MTMAADSLLFSLPVQYRVIVILAVLALIAAVSWKKRLLDSGGIAAAAILGFIVFFTGGVSGFVVFLFFFLFSSVISKVCSRKKEGGRTASQVVANGLPAAAALLSYKALGYPEASLVAFAAAVAEAAADTWAGEIGQLSRKDPVSIITFTKVPKGISGGVTVLGLAASALAAVLVAVLYIGTFGGSWRALLAISAAGFLGSLLDSFLGASVQVQYRKEDGTLTEEKTPVRARGIPFMDNDAVNFLSGLFSVSLSIALYSF